MPPAPSVPSSALHTGKVDTDEDVGVPHPGHGGGRSQRPHRRSAGVPQPGTPPEQEPRWLLRRTALPSNGSCSRAPDTSRGSRCSLPPSGRCCRGIADLFNTTAAVDRQGATMRCICSLITRETEFLAKPGNAMRFLLLPLACSIQVPATTILETCGGEYYALILIYFSLLINLCVCVCVLI